MVDQTGLKGKIEIIVKPYQDLSFLDKAHEGVVEPGDIAKN